MRTGLTLGKIADRIGGELHGDPVCEITSVASLRSAREGAISFLANSYYLQDLCTTRASAVILRPELADRSPTATIKVRNPYAAFARIAVLLSPPLPPQRGMHASAIISNGASVDATAWIGPRCVVESGATVAAGVQVAAGCFIGRDSRLGENTCLGANVVICDDVRIGCRTIIHPGVVIGSDGFGLADDNGQWLKIPQLGGVRIGNDVEIGANTTIDRGALDNTVIGDGVKLDNQIQVAHNVCIGAHTAIAGCTGISGSARIGSHCMIGGGVGIVGHLEITDHVTVTGMTMVTESITRPGVYSSGVPAQENRAWNRNYARLRQLDTLARRLQTLERKSDGST